MSKELEAFYKVLKRSEFAYIGHNDVDMVIKALTPTTEENDSKVYLEEHSLINLASGDYTSLDLEHDNNRYFITGYGDGVARLEISYETAVKIIKDLRWGVIK